MIASAYRLNILENIAVKPIDIFPEFVYTCCVIFFLLPDNPYGYTNTYLIMTYRHQCSRDSNVNRRICKG